MGYVKNSEIYRLLVNFTSILHSALAPISFHQKITNLNYKQIKAAQKAACKILVKLSPRGQFHQHFTKKNVDQYLFAKKSQSQNVTKEKLHKTVLNEKFAHKMLVKLAPEVITNASTKGCLNENRS